MLRRSWIVVASLFACTAPPPIDKAVRLELAAGPNFQVQFGGQTRAASVEELVFLSEKIVLHAPLARGEFVTEGEFPVEDELLLDFALGGRVALRDIPQGRYLGAEFQVRLASNVALLGRVDADDDPSDLETTFFVNATTPTARIPAPGEFLIRDDGRELRVIADPEALLSGIDFAALQPDPEDGSLVMDIGPNFEAMLRFEENLRSAFAIEDAEAPDLVVAE
jgi:hypothetical protein